MMFEEVMQHRGNKFYAVDKDLISSVQEEMGVILPKELRDFYSEVGYGFLKSEGYNFNRILSPSGVCDFRLRKGQFSDNYELEVYEEYERDRIVFFEVCEGNYITIGFSKTTNGKIYYGDEEIAPSLKEFLVKYLENEFYYN